MSNSVRTVTHEIDSEARAIVSTLIPKKWEHREPGGRDYGVDLQLERFEDQKATGNILLLQIKGTRSELDERDLHFDLPVQTLKYAEMFVVPFLLVLCPTKSMPAKAYCCWLQEHIKVNLDFDNPTWRDNAATVRIHFNPKFKLAEAADVLGWISEEPQRLRDWLQVASLQHNFKYLIPKLEIHTDRQINDQDIESGAKFVEKLKSLKSLFNHPTGYWLAHYVNLLEKSLELMHRKGPYTLQDVKFAGAIEKLSPEFEEYTTEDQVARMLLSMNLQTARDGLMTTLSQYFDDGLKRSGLMATEAYFDPLSALKKHFAQSSEQETALE